MSPPDDASLTAGERAALAGLEANAAAEDPSLASRLRGSGRRPVIAHPGRIRTADRPGWWGAPLVLIGLILVALSLSTAWALGVVGSLIAVGGLYLIAASVARRGAEPRSDGPS
jgi:Protein of unknown function (DUF3040)